MFSSLPIIIWERRWLVIIPTVLLAIAGVVASLVIPPSYQSRAVLLVESQDLPSDDDRKPTTGESEVDRRMAKIREQILSRPDLVELIQAHDLYNASNREQPLSALVEKMRAATSITAVDADIDQGGPNRRGSASIAFSLTFDYPRPALAQLVAQTFVDRLLKLDAATTQAQAQNSVRFLEDQEATLTQQLQAVESQINQLAGSNGQALAPGAIPNLGGGANNEGQIATLERENAQLRAQTGATAVDRDPGVVSALAALNAARAQYSDDHPDVKLAESRLAAARQAAQSYQAKTTSSTVEAQIAANNTMIAELRRSQNAEQSRAAIAAAAAARGPAIQQKVAQLTAQADLIRGNLGKVSSSLLTARSNSKMADEQRGERLSLIEPPARPDRPTSPNRPLLIGGGIGGGLVLGLILAMLVEILIRPIRSSKELTRLTGEPPLTVIPVLSKKRFKKKKPPRFGRRRRAYG
ncbi:Wzz/FepE/Etk N-terminal domain-containing protein [Sphingomonas sp.]|uniref:Wzz/FepE/Etk N-terminal domain-containing protein n=1 Tax=Sphingomonas sp. TaxID=28214 RepID=UPI0025D7BEBB|nr:Wzz/FepE/Etk N-terminal domain-containing protein [Sphingomonas sp.]